ncbi:restriction endonuclease subunit S [Pseudomonas fulva]|uniref:restriction endonuclease subunit S n=1 Tax=Pseudomonas fulva TaxID=47880 RepID=UPI00201DBDE4|nr:restriction endonuclease subunit S [Pseudomonas fulva]UQY32969.1 restriction endonuclease subunit S [Pseudomonas fulva]
MKAGWETKPLGEIIQLEYGKPLDASQRKSDGLYPVYGANGEKDRSDTFFYDKPSIIVGRKGSAGEVNLTEARFWPLDVTYFVTFDETRFDLQFLYHLLSHLELPKLAKGVKPGINRNEVYAIDVATPRLPEQQRIVAILDEAFAGIAMARAAAEQNRQNARAFFESHLQSVFSQRGEGWMEVTVGQLVRDGVIAKPQDGNHGEIHPTKADYVEVGIPFLMAADLLGGRVDTKGCRFISEQQARSLRIGFSVDQDVLLSHKGTIGRVAILETDQEFVMLTPQVTYYRVLKKSEISNHYLYFYFHSPKFRNQIEHVSGAGSTRAYIGITKQLDLKILLPPIAIQQQLAVQLKALQDESRHLESLYMRKLTALDELKQSLLHQAFSGNL